jgi:ABC-2 type transport system permease protein
MTPKKGPGKFNWGRTYAMARKEVFHVMRDPFTLAFALVWPVVVVIIFGYAMDFNIKNISMSVYDADRSQSTRELLDTFSSSDYFLISEASSPHEAIDNVQGERAKAAMDIPPTFQKDLLSGQGSDVQILLDGSDNSTVSPTMGYIGQIQNMAAARLAGASAASGVDLRTRFLFNPELNSRWFIIPGLAVVVMSMLAVLLTALTVAREWENGSMELLLSTPVRPAEIIIGKLAPYAVLGMSAVTLVYLVARILFDVPFAGSHLIFILGSLLFLGTYLAQGLLISVTVRRQVIAMQLAIISGLLPSQLLSGFVFPIESMPPFFRYFTAILPARWYMVVARDTFLEAANLWQLRVPFFALILINIVMITLASRKFKKDLE